METFSDLILRHSTQMTAEYLFLLVGSINLVEEFKLEELVDFSVLKFGGACNKTGAAFSYKSDKKLSKPASSVFPRKFAFSNSLQIISSE